MRIVKQKTLLNEKDGLAVVSTALKRLQASGEIGSEGFSAFDALKLAKHFEIFEPVSGNFMRAGHDLVADFLAASRLALEWRQHQTHLQSTIAEDAWVFAGKGVAETEKEEFIQCVANVDLILAARCAVTMGVPTVTVVEKRVFELDDQKTTYSSGIAAIAMSILKTDAAFIRLRSRLIEKENDRKFQAIRALAMIGDKVVLRSILKEEDPKASAGLQFSGGHIGIWEDAGSPVATLELARERLKTAAVSGEEGICLSLRTVARYGDQSDVETIEKIAMQTKNLPTFYDSIHCLQTLDESRSMALLRQVATDENRGFELIAIETLSANGEKIDTSGLLKSLLEFKGKREEAYENIQRAIRIIKGNPLPKDGEVMLLKAYTEAGNDLKANIWAIATAHCLSSFDDIAFKIVEDCNMAEMGFAANHASVRFVNGIKMERFANLCEQRIVDLENDVIRNGWHLRRIFDYLLQIGRKSVVAGSVERILRRFLPEHHRINREKDQNPQKHFQPPQNGADQRYDIFLELELKEYVCIAGELAELMPNDLIRLAAGFRLLFAGKDVLEPFAKLMAQLSPEELDQELSNISTSHNRIFALGAVAPLGATQIRREILIRDFPIALQWHMTYNAISSALPTLWCREVCIAITEVISKAKWSVDIGSQLFRGPMMTITHLMTREFAEEIVRPKIVKATNPASREMLQYWYEAAVAKREIGSKQ